jgi:formimidoylglutamate deiminase
VQTLFLTNALLPHGWARDVLVMLTPHGRIASLVSDSVCPPHAERLAGAAIAGIPNLHSHAHQRAIAGLAEHSGDRPDTFWTWREVMYRALDRMDPDDFEVVATQLYVEMAKAGFTAVAEFHYLHHDRDGRHYSDPAELGHRAIAAARTAGVAITLLPVLYASSGFGGTAPTFSQRRFIHDALSFSEMIASLRSAYRLAADVRIGIAPHSLRAVPPNLLAEVASVHDSGPIHIHVAERKEEVEECLVHTGCKPVEWLLENHDVDSRWCLVHATHVTPAEIAGMAQRGVIVGLCPTTEGNLGDGIFPAEYFLACSGRFGIGSDSHISVNPVEELRWLEYAMRLATGRRNVLAGGPHRSTGRQLLEHAQLGGAQACGITAGQLAVGHRADLVVLDSEHPLLAARSGDALLDSWIFAGNTSVVRDVVVGGRVIVQSGHHANEDAIARRFKDTLRKLFA